jgi:glutathione S-transferase
MELVYATILLALLEYIVMAGLVGRARAKTGISAPAMTGHPDFERANRVHVNTLENLIIFVPAVWIFATYSSALYAAILGALFVVARALYAVGYLRAAEKRAVGAGITGIVNIVLVVGGLIGIARALL